MAEIEHFVDPNDKSHPKFSNVADYEMAFFSACNQMDGKPAESMTIGQAVASVGFGFLHLQKLKKTFFIVVVKTAKKIVMVGT